MAKRKPINDGRVDAEFIAQTYSVDRMTIYRMRRKGKLPAFKVGGQYRFDINEVEKALREQNAANVVTE